MSNKHIYDIEIDLANVHNVKFLNRHSSVEEHTEPKHRRIQIFDFDFGLGLAELMVILLWGSEIDTHCRYMIV